MDNHLQELPNSYAYCEGLIVQAGLAVVVVAVVVELTEGVLDVAVAFEVVVDDMQFVAILATLVVTIPVVVVNVHVVLVSNEAFAHVVVPVEPAVMSLMVFLLSTDSVVEVVLDAVTPLDAVADVVGYVLLVMMMTHFVPYCVVVSLISVVLVVSAPVEKVVAVAGKIALFAFGFALQTAATAVVAAVQIEAAAALVAVHEA